MMNALSNKKCVSCEGKDIKPFSKDEAEVYMNQVPSWILDVEGKMISKEFKFKDFIGAINFVNNISEIVEEEGHHPDIHVLYNKVRLDLSTHAIDGLSENDFIMAAKIDMNSSVRNL